MRLIFLIAAICSAYAGFILAYMEENAYSLPAWRVVSCWLVIAGSLMWAALGWHRWRVIGVVGLFLAIGMSFVVLPSEMLGQVMAAAFVGFALGGSWEVIAERSQPKKREGAN